MPAAIKAEATPTLYSIILGAQDEKTQSAVWRKHVLYHFLAALMKAGFRRPVPVPSVTVSNLDSEIGRGYASILVKATVEWRLITSPVFSNFDIGSGP